MDYGKLALMKAEEIERRLIKTNERVECRDYTAKPTFDLSSGKAYRICAINGGGTITIALIITLSGNETNGNLEVSLGNTTIIKQSFAIESSGEKTITLMRAIKLDSEQILSVSSNDLIATVESVQVVVFGAKVDLITNLSSSAVDFYNGEWILAVSQNDRVRIYPFGENNFNLNNSFFVGSGSCCDICAGEDGFLVSYIDDQNNTVIARINADYSISDYTVVGGGATLCAISRYKSGYLLCEVIDGKVYCTSVSNNFAFGERELVQTPFSVESVNFVKNALRPMLLLYGQGRSYLKYASINEETHDNVAVSLSIAVNGQ